MPPGDQLPEKKLAVRKHDCFSAKISESFTVGVERRSDPSLNHIDPIGTQG